MSTPDLAVGATVDVTVEPTPLGGSGPGEASNGQSQGTAQKRIWEVAAEIGASVPAADWGKVPTDLAKNVDHYLYGAKKDPGEGA